MVLMLILGVTGLLVVVQLVRLAITDCDLTLQWASRFGKKVGKTHVC